MANLLSNSVAFVFALGVIIFVHEFGHLAAARLFGVRVLVFSLGFGTRIWGFRRGGTDYRVSLIPFGGYVRLGGDEPEAATGAPDEFLSRPRWQRIAIYLAGPAMNVVLAVVLMAVVFMVGIAVPVLPNIPPVVGAVEEGSPAAAAGLQVGDRITEVMGRQVERWEEVRFALMTSPEQPLTLTVRRGPATFTAELTPEKVPGYEFGDAGVYPRYLPRVHRVLPDSPAAAAGFRTGDELREVDGRPIGSLEDFVAYIEERPGEAVEVEALREGQPLKLRVVPRPEGGAGKIGVVLTYTQRYGPAEAFLQSLRYNYEITRQTFIVLGKIVSRRLAAKSALSGPIEIAAMSGAAARTGFRHLLHLMGLISISIAILNLLPIPLLDGGQIAILCFESLRRRDLPLRVKERINLVGLVLLVLLMVMVVYFDILKNLPAGVSPGS